MKLIRHGVLGLCLLGLVGCDEAANPVSDVQSVFQGGGRADASLSPAQRELRSREQAYRNARLQAAGIGAGVGLITGILTDAEPEETALYTVVGAAGGYYVGASLVEQNASFQTAQQVLSDDIGRARQDTQRLQQSVQSAESALNYQRSEIARLNSGLRSQEVSAAQYRARYQTMQGDLTATRNLRQSAEERVSGLRSSISGYRRKNVQTGQLNAQLQQQESRLARIRQIERSMVSGLNSVPSNIRAGS